MSEAAIGQVLAQMRAMTAAAGHTHESTTTPGPQATGEFANVLRDSLAKVNQLQQQANHATAAFERGDQDVDIARVMIALEKASLSFEALTQTRNRLLAAYQDIMNMPV